MILQDAVDRVSDKFVYTNDPTVTSDAWFVMREMDGRFHGDCEDFALTAYWIFSGQSMFKFLWNLLISRSYGLWGVRASDSAKVNHCVAEMDGLWFDNWTRRAMSEREFIAKTGHAKSYKFGSFAILVKLLIGLRFRNSYK